MNIFKKSKHEILVIWDASSQDWGCEVNSFSTLEQAYAHLVELEKRVSMPDTVKIWLSTEIDREQLHSVMKAGNGELKDLLSKIGI